MKKDYTLGIISGVILTFIGIFIQFQMNKNYENKKEIKKMNIESIKHLDNRLFRSELMLDASESSKFNDRWDNYIYNVIYPWNSNLYIIDVHIKQKHLEIYNEFDTVCNSFRKVHGLLNQIRKLQGVSSITQKKILKTKENETKAELENLKLKINFIKDKLLL